MLLFATALTAVTTPALAQVKASGIPVKSSTNSTKSENREWISELRAMDLVFPVPGIQVEHLKDTFDEARDGHRVHHALDIPALRGTPVLSVDSGRIIKLHQSKDGGLMIYTANESAHFIYYYAHLDHYRDGITEGMPLSPGDTIGFVGTTGNAPPDTPHLHFAILRSKNISKWSKGPAIDPYKVFIK